jgi:hypothetical protein
MLAVSYDEADLTVDSLLIGALHDGTWDRLRALLARGIGAELAHQVPSRTAQQEAETAFRRARGMLAGEDLRAWLAARDLTLTEWRSHIRLKLLGEDRDGLLPVVPLDSLPDAARAAVAIEGIYEAAARPMLFGAASGEPPPMPDPALSEALAVRAADDSALPVERRDLSSLTREAEVVLRLHGQLERARSQVDEQTIRDTVAEHALDWTVLLCDEIVLDTEAAAREAMLCLSSDGVGLRAVAGLAGKEVREGMEIGAQAADPALLAAEVGASVGPLAVGAGWAVQILAARRAPDPADPNTRTRARDLALERVLERRLAGRLRWHVTH